MEELQNYILDKIIFDAHEDENGEEFDSVLFDELDRLTIYDEDCKAFFDIAPDMVLKLASATMQGEWNGCNFRASKTGKTYSMISVCDDNLRLSDIVSKAIDTIVFNYIYTELKAKYMEQLER